MVSTRLAQLIVRIAIYFAIIICSFVIFCSVGISLHYNHGHCVLYARIHLNSFVVPGERSVCNYNIAQAVVFCLILPIVTIIFNVFIFVRKMSGKRLCFIQVVIDGVALFFVLITACTISVGLKAVCDSFRSHYPYSPCSSNSIIYNGNDKVDFYGTLRIAEIAAWITFLLWLIQLISSVISLKINQSRTRDTPDSATKF